MDAYDWARWPKEFQRRLDAIARYSGEVPPGTEVAYGLFARKIEFSPFTDDTVEMRRNLDGLAARARSGALGDVPAVWPAFYSAIDYIEYPAPPKAEAPSALPALRSRPKGLPLNGTRPGDMIVMVFHFVFGYPPLRDFQDSEARCLRDNVRFYAILAGDGDSGLDVDPGTLTLDRFARATGGTSYELESSGFAWSNGFGAASIVRVEVPPDAKILSCGSRYFSLWRGVENSL